MRFHSTPQSALDGEITILAIIETVISVVIYVGLGLYFGTFKYLAWAVVVAPLMLFRTEASANWGLNTYEQCLTQLWRLPANWDGIANGVLGPLIGVAIRITATFYWVMRRPFLTLKEVPKNWLRQSLCIDFFYPPEILPLEATKGQARRIFTFARVVKFFRSKEKIFLKQDGPMVLEKVIWFLFTLPLLLVGYAPSLIYRVSFKATAIAYTPFVWVAHATLRNPLTAKLRLERFTKVELEKVRRVISLFIVTILAAKIALVWGGWLEQSFIESKFPSKKLAEAVVMFGSWPWWQFTLLADALLTFFLFFFGDAALGRIDSPQAWKEERTLGTVSSLSFLRAALALVTIGHFFLIALRVVAPKSLQAFL